MLPIQVFCRAVHDEELAPVRPPPLIRHRQHAPPLAKAPRALNLVFKPPPPAALPAFPSTSGIPALDHEGSDVAVEGHGGVVAAFGEREEVPDGEGGELG